MDTVGHAGAVGWHQQPGVFRHHSKAAQHQGEPVELPERSRPTQEKPALAGVRVPPDKVGA